MSEFANLRQRLFGKPLDPLDTKARRHIALVAFFAWVGLGADGISSSCYGPEEALRALGEHTELGLYLARNASSGPLQGEDNPSADRKSTPLDSSHRTRAYA